VRIAKIMAFTAQSLTKLVKYEGLPMVEVYIRRHPIRCSFARWFRIWYYHVM